MSAHDLRSIFVDVKVGQSVKFNDLSYQLAAILVYSGHFEGQQEYWIEFELKSLQKNISLEFNDGSWTYSESFAPKNPKDLEAIKNTTEGSVVVVDGETYTVEETTEATVELLEGRPSDDTEINECFNYADLKGSRSSRISYEWGNFVSRTAYSIKSTSMMNALTCLGVRNIKEAKGALSQYEISDDDYGGAPAKPNAYAIFAGLAVFAIMTVTECDGGASFAECRQRVQSELRATGIPEGDSIRQSDVRCHHIRTRTRRFGK